MKQEDNLLDKVKCTVDCVLFSFEDYKLKVLLVSENSGKEWSFLKSKINYKSTIDETIDELIYKNLGIDKVFSEQIRTNTSFDSILNEQSISTTYYALLTKENIDSKLNQNNVGQWFSIQELPALKSSQIEMIQLALNNLKIKGMISPIVFELLPDKFTLKQVQELYEQICLKKLDKRNFIKKISTFDFIVKLNEKDKTTSTKGSYLHKLDQSLVGSINSFYLNLLKIKGY